MSERIIGIPFQKGNPGKPHGAKSHMKPTAKRLEELGFDWIAECVNRFRDENLPNASRDYALGLLVDRVAPKLKAVEITGAGGSELGRISINIIPATAIPQPVLDVTPEAVAIAHDQVLDWVLDEPEMAEIEPSQACDDAGMES